MKGKVLSKAFVGVSAGVLLAMGVFAASVPAQDVQEGSVILNLSNGELTAQLNGEVLENEALSERGIALDKGVLKLSGAGSYTLSGSLEGHVEVTSSKSDDVELILNGFSVACEDTAAIQVTKTKNLRIYAVEGSKNHIQSGEAVEIDDTTAKAVADNSGGALYSKANTVISGDGELTIEGYINNGLQVTKDLEILAGNVSISAVNNAIKSKQLITVGEGAGINVLSGNDGIKAEDEEAEVQTGDVVINGGSINIDSFGDGIVGLVSLTVNGGAINIKTEGEYNNVAEGDSSGGPGGNSRGGQQTASVSEKGLKSDGDLSINGGIIDIDSVDDAIHSNSKLEVSGGVMTLSTGDDGLHGKRQVEIKGGDITIKTSVEGIEGNQILVSGGKINLVSSDDGFNANGGPQSFSGPGGNSQSSSDRITDMPNLIISGGEIYVNASGDGLDSNGNITVSGGYTVVDGPTNSMNGALDCGMENGGKITISGGTVFAWGASGMAESFDRSSTQCSFSCTSKNTLKAGTVITIKKADGEVIFSHEVASSGNSTVFSSPELVMGESYILSDGEKEGEFTISKIVTSFRGK